MALSVLTIVKNRPGHLAQLMEGLRRSAMVPCELVVVDMGSDPPVSVAEMPFPVSVVRFDHGGLPLAAARNAAARAAQGNFLLFLDVDCIPMGGLVSAMAEVLALHDGLVCAQVRYLGPEQAREDWNEADLLSRSHSHPARDFPDVGIRRESDPGLFWALVFGMRRTSFFRLGEFDEEFTGYGGEDTDFGFRAREKGTPLLFMGGPGAFHQHHDTFHPPLQHLEDIVRNARVFHARWGWWPMEGWLAAFEKLGLIEWTRDVITLRRLPTSKEILRAKVTDWESVE